MAHNDFYLRYKSFVIPGKANIPPYTFIYMFGFSLDLENVYIFHMSLDKTNPKHNMCNVRTFISL